MILYVLNVGHKETKLIKIEERDNQECPDCQTKLERPPQGGHFQLEGPGFYGTDYNGTTSR